MPRESEFIRQMSEEAIEEFDQLASRRSSKLIDLQTFLRGHGVKASRSAVGRYMKKVRLRRGYLPEGIRSLTAGQSRYRIARHIDTMPEDELLILLHVARAFPSQAPKKRK